MGFPRINNTIAETIGELKNKEKPQWYRKEELERIKQHLEKIKQQYNATHNLCSKIQ